jgi:hypothetical protein
MALPMTTRGFRTVFDRRTGMLTVSGSSAERGLRGVMRLGSLDLVDAAPLPLVCRSAKGGGATVGTGGTAPAGGLRGAVAAAGRGCWGVTAGAAATGLLAGAVGGDATAGLPAGALLAGEAAAGLLRSALGCDAPAGLLAGAFAGDAAVAIPLGRGLTAVGTAGAASVSGGTAPRWPPLGGGFEPVTADYPLLQNA